MNTFLKLLSDEGDTETGDMAVLLAAVLVKSRVRSGAQPRLTDMGVSLDSRRQRYPRARPSPPIIVCRLASAVHLDVS